MFRRLTAVAVTAAAGLALGVGATPASAATCANATLQPANSTQLVQAESAVLCLVNNQRAAVGRPALKLNGPLINAARAHSQDMITRDFFSHTNPENESLSTRFKRFGYTLTGSWAVGENISCGAGPYSTPQNVVSRWMASPGHKANILSATFVDTGVGAKIGSSGPSGCNTANAVHYTQTFGKHG
jgi:uncharacterized protein YkwD